MLHPRDLVGYVAMRRRLRRERLDRKLAHLRDYALHGPEGTGRTVRAGILLTESAARTRRAER